MADIHPSQRGYFAHYLLEAAKKDKDIILVTADLGFGMFDRFMDELPNQFYNCGAAEQCGMGICVGLALEGKKPFFYTISSFLLRAAETISLYISHEQIPVRLIGSGRDSDYKIDGYSHDGTQAQKFIHDMQIDELYPTDKESIPNMVKTMVEVNSPWFISLRK